MLSEVEARARDCENWVPHVCCANSGMTSNEQCEANALLDEPRLHFASKLSKKPLAIADGLNGCKSRRSYFKLVAKLIRQCLRRFNQRFNFIERDTCFLKCIVKIQS